MIGTSIVIANTYIVYSNLNGFPEAGQQLQCRERQTLMACVRCFAYNRKKDNYCPHLVKLELANNILDIHDSFTI